MSTIRLEESLKEIYRAGLEAVDPETAVARFLGIENGHLRAGEQVYPLDKFRKIFLLGFGKAGVPMAQAVEAILREKLESGMIIVKHGHGGRLERTQVFEAGHPEPDQAGLDAAQEILRFLSQQVTSDDLVLVVVSGGGSALLPAPVEAISFDDKRRVTRLLIRCGAAIQEINTLRKHLSRVKGGRLVTHTGGAQVIAMLLSDVVGDDLASIASGPTVPDPTTFADCLQVVHKYGLRDQLPQCVVRYLESGTDKIETPKPGSPLFERVQNSIVANNRLALEACAERSSDLGFDPLILSSSIEGNTADAALFHVAIAREILQYGDPVRRPCCVISGGETTVQVKGDGKGGRNQEFVLWCALATENWEQESLLFASLGSDGNDGPTDAAGAFASPQTASRAAELGLSIRDSLERNDSYHFFEATGELIRTGPTRTNVMDMRFILVGPAG